MIRTFPVFTEWAEHVTDVGQLTGTLSTVFGWRLNTANTPRPNTLRNFPMQANGAEMLRIACCLSTERGIEVCAPVHDALLVEAPADEIDQVVGATRQAMAETGAAVLGGMEIKTDAEVIRWPDRYADPRGAVMWTRVMELLDRTDEEAL